MSGLPFSSPVMVAAGCGGSGREAEAFGGLVGVGGFVSRTLTLAARVGWPAPRIAAADSGIVHSAGLPNQGPEHFLALELPGLVKAGVAPVASVAAATEEEWAQLVGLLAPAPGLRGFELNFADDAGLAPHQNAEWCRRVVSATRARASGLPVLVKVGPTRPDLTAAVAAVLEAGADAVVLGGGVPAVMPTGRLGSLVGPAVLPVALRAVLQVQADVPEASIIASGGIRTTADARRFLEAGAVAVQVGSAMLVDPTTAAQIAADLTTDLDQGVR